jgi:hypothetical protein
MKNEVRRCEVEELEKEQAVASTFKATILWLARQKVSKLKSTYMVIKHTSCMLPLIDDRTEQ